MAHEITCSEKERNFLAGLHAAFQKAQREFEIGLTGVLLSRSEQDVTFLGFTSTGILVDAPEAPDGAS